MLQSSSYVQQWILVLVSLCKLAPWVINVNQLRLGNYVTFWHSVSGTSAKASEEDQERTRRLADAEMHRHHLESLLDQREREITALREVKSSLAMGGETFQFSCLLMLSYLVYTLLSCAYTCAFFI